MLPRFGTLSLFGQAGEHDTPDMGLRFMWKSKQLNAHRSVFSLPGPKVGTLRACERSPRAPLPALHGP